MNRFLSASSHFLTRIGLAFIRIGIGALFVVHGYTKLIAGPSKWIWIGSQMRYLGITFFPLGWGLLAACIEFFGGIALVFGLGTRVALFFMSQVMIVALVYHVAIGDSFTIYSHPLSLLVVLIGLFISGAGIWSFDTYQNEKGE